MSHALPLYPLLVALSGGCATSAAVSAAAGKSELDAAIDKFVSATPNLASLEIAIVRDGRVIYTRGVGEAVAGTRLPPNSHTPYRIGSVTKPITGLALAQLRESGLLTFDDRLDHWLPEVARVKYPSKDHPAIRIRQLFTHSSGLPRQAEGYSNSASEDELLGALRTMTLRYTPGDREQYSNYAMALAGAVIHRASGESYPEFVENHILRPLAMTETGFRIPNGVATGYRVDGMRISQRELTDGPTGWAPAGDLFSTAGDLVKFALFELSAWDEDESEVPSSVLSRSGLQETQVPWGGSYAVNWVVGNFEGLRWVWHNGSFEGHHALLSMLPRAKAAIVLLDTSKNGEGLFIGELQRELLLTLARGRSGLSIVEQNRRILELLRRAVNGSSLDALFSLFSREMQDYMPKKILMTTFFNMHDEHGVCDTTAPVRVEGEPGAQGDIICRRGRLTFRWTWEPSSEHILGLFWH